MSTRGPERPDRGLRVGGGLVGVAAVLAAVNTVLVNVGTSLIDADAVRPWSWLVWTGIAVLAVAGVVAGVVLYRRDGRAAGAGRWTAATTHIAGDQINVYHPPPRAAEPAPPVAGSNLPLPNRVFTGRARVLGRVAAGLSAGPVAVVAVRGLGGIGKSQTALEHAHRGRADGRYDVTWWVRAETELTIAEDLAALAPALGVPVGTDQKETVAGVQAVLRGRDRWLLVFDNAPSAAAVRGWLPVGPGEVLVTSRDRGWATLATEVLVDEFDRAESVDYLRARLGRDDPDAGTLAELLGDLPLALAQAASWLDLHGDPPIARYLGLYRDRAAAGALLADAAGDDYPHTVATTWLIHFTDLAATAPAALELLRLCAHLDPDDIDLTLLLSQPGALQGEPTAHLAAATDREREDAIGALTRTGLVTRLDADRIRLHRLVADITRSQLDQPPHTWAARAIDVLVELFPLQPWEPDDWPDCARLAPHATAAVDHIAGRPTAATAVILNRLGQYLRSRAEYAPARTAHELALAIGEAVLGPDRSEVAVSLTNLSNVQGALGELAAARTSLDRALTIFEAVHGPHHPAVAGTLCGIGILQRELGELTAARTSQQRALAIEEAVYGPHHPQVARTLTNLSNVQHLLGELAAARTSLDRALAIKEAVYGPDHLEVAITVGILQQRLRELATARASQKRALAIKEAAYGPDHPDVAGTLNNLGNVQYQMGELSAARTSLDRSLRIFEAVYGAHHPQGARTLANLGRVQQELGELTAARTSLDRALRIFGVAYGPDHPSTALAGRWRAELDDPPGA